MNSAEILREAAFEEGYKAGKKAVLDLVFNELGSLLVRNKLTHVGITTYSGSLKYDIEDLKKKLEETK